VHTCSVEEFIVKISHSRPWVESPLRLVHFFVFQYYATGCTAISRLYPQGCARAARIFEY
jgi:hypothetical protein